MTSVSRSFGLVATWLPALIISGALLVTVIWYDHDYSEPRLFIKLSGGAEGEMNVYWDTGSGFSEAFSDAKPLGKYTRQLLVWKIPEGVVSFRVDPTLDADTVRLDALRIGRFERLGSRALDAAALQHFHQMEAEVSGTQQLRFRFHEGAYDPYFIVFDVQERIADAKGTASHWFPILVGVALLPLLVQMGLSTRRSFK